MRTRSGQIEGALERGKPLQSRAAVLGPRGMPSRDSDSFARHDARLEPDDARPPRVAEIRSLAEAVSAGAAQAEILRCKRAHVLTARARLSSGRTVIVKLWSLHGVRPLLRRATGTTGPTREWKVLRRLHAAGVSVPRPFGRFTLSGESSRHTDALVLEDLGPCVRGGEHLQALVKARDDDDAWQLEEEVIRITAGMIENGVLDPDHSLMNFVVTPGSHVVRLDLELARRVCWVNVWPALEALMLGRLIATHAFVVQPDVERTTRFAARLIQAVTPHRRILPRAAREVARLLEKQRRDEGIDTRVCLPW